jgi:uncharacterized protein YjiS (DUF1127 family)
MALVHSEKARVIRAESSIRQVRAWLTHRFQAWRRDAVEQRYLASLNDYYLRDLGLARSDVDRDPMPPHRFR